MVHTKVLTAVIVAGAAVAVLSAQQDGVATRAVGGSGAIRLSATAHPPVPRDLSAMWYAPAQGAAVSPALAGFVRGVKLLEDDNNAAAALPLVSAPALQSTPLADYARYYTGLALQRLERFDAAEAAFADVAARAIEGHLPEDAALRQAEVREARKNPAGALALYESLVTGTLSRPHVVWLRLGLAADAAGNRARAIEGLRRVYYEYPLSTEADQAGAALKRLDVAADRSVAALEFSRAEALFKARRFEPAKTAYERAQPFIGDQSRAQVAVRLAACDVMLGRFRAGRRALEPWLDGPLADEAGFYAVTATRGLKEKDEHVRQARRFVERHPSSPFAEEVLNALASAYIIDDEDDQADAVFLELLDRYPAGRFAERAAWKAGWWAYRQGRFDAAVRLFDRGAQTFPRSDYRPSWLYWSGRASERLGDTATAMTRLRLAATDYHNSYYGRLAVRRLADLRQPAVAASVEREVPPIPGPPVPTAGRITMLLAAGLNREALSEVQYAQRMWGDSPQLQATLALAHRRIGNVRAGINAMKRAYPQYLAAGGESLPGPILQVIFPVDYWPLLQKYAAQRGLDPYLVAALVAQESNFDAVVISHANAVGLMQVLPSTGRAYARKMGIRPFSPNRLTNAEVNVRIGTQIFINSIKKFGGVHFALAAYNAGDSRVAGWQRERPGMPQDEFIDDIPFSETQNYVKRILGTAEDYRRLYGSKATD